MGNNLADYNEATTIDLATAAFYLAIGFTPNPSPAGTDKWARPKTVLLALTGDNNVTAFTSLANAISTIGSTKARLLIPISTNVTVDTTIPENITVVDTGSGDLTVSATKTLTVNGPAEIGNRHFFKGSGNVVLGSKITRVNPYWFGALGNARRVTDAAMVNTGGANVITSATAAFTSAMVGMAVDMQGVGATASDLQGISSRHNQVGTITGYNSPTSITVSFTNAGASVTGKTLTWGTDDSTPVASAIGAKSTYASLYFPAGNYVINTQMSLLSGSMILGDGKGITNLYWVGPTRNGSASKLFYVGDSKTRVTIRNLSIFGTNVGGIGIMSATQNAIEIGTGATGNIDNVTVENCEIAYIWGMGIRTNGDVGDQAGSDPTNIALRFRNLDVHHCSDNGINPNTGGGLLIQGCNLTDNGADGCEFAGSRFQILGNYIARNRLGGVALGGLGNPSLGKDNICAHNIIERNGISGNAGHGVQIGGNVVHALVTSNIIRENSLQGIGVNDGNPDFSSLSRDIRISNNQVISNGMPGSGPGYGITCSMNDVVIESNDVFDDGVSGYSQGYGIFIAAGDGVKLLRNRARNNIGYDYEIISATNVLLVREDTTSTIQQYEPNGIAGTVDTSGTTVTYKTGTLFQSRWVGVPIKIDTTYYVIASVAAAPTGNYTVSGTTVTRTSGTNFNTAWVGQYIRLGANTWYQIASVGGASTLTISNPYGITPPASGAWVLYGSETLTLTTSAGTQSAKAYVIPPHVVYLPDNSVMQTVAFNGGTPIFDAQQGNVFKITLTGNVTASQLVNGVDGQVVTFFIFQDGTGSRTFVHSAAVLGATTIGSTASKNNVQSFRKHGSNWYAVAAGVNNQ